jgi:ribosome biogenesis protein ERB1
MKAQQPPPPESDTEEEDYDEEDDVDEEDDEEEEEDFEEDESNEDSDGFEQQSSSDESVEEDDESEADGNEDAAEETKKVESHTRQWNSGQSRTKLLEEAKKSGDLLLQQYMHVDDLSSDDEDAAGNNTVGRIPLHWYDAFDHIGYSIDGTKLLKRPGKDRIDLALQNRDDPLALRRIYDMYNDREVVLSERELEIIRRIQSGAFAHPEFNDTPDYVDYFTHEKEIMPLSAAPEPKARFLPSKWEMMKVMKIAKAMKEGRYKMKKPEKPADESQSSGYLLWKDDEDELLLHESNSRRFKFHLPAPKMPLPGHAESYNPPEEYLLSEEELKKFNEADPEDRPYNFEPRKYSCLRHVEGYQNFVRERFERCLDLYLCPRKLKKRLNIDPETLIPKLPSPSELKPFPNRLVLQFLGHAKGVTSLSVSPDGQYLASGSEDGQVKVWEVDSGFCKFSWDFSGLGRVSKVDWNPDPMNALLAVAVGKSLLLITTGTGDADSLEITESHLESLVQAAAAPSDETKGSDDESEAVEESDEDEDDDSTAGNKMNEKKVKSHWRLRTDGVRSQGKGVTVGPRLELSLDFEISTFSWHHKGDYLAVLCPKGGKQAVSVHQISKASSQFPFHKTPGLLQSIAFHPFLPCLVIVTQQHVKIFHLVEQKLVKKLLSGCKWLSSIDIHPSGDHIIVGSYDRRVVWFDLDLSSTPYKTLKFHEKAVRDVKFHK